MNLSVKSFALTLHHLARCWSHGAPGDGPIRHYGFLSVAARPPCCTHNPFNGRPLRYYCSAGVGAVRWGKQHQRDWFLLMGHFIMGGNGVGERGWDGQRESEGKMETHWDEFSQYSFCCCFYLLLWQREWKSYHEAVCTDVMEGSRCKEGGKEDGGMQK